MKRWMLSKGLWRLWIPGGSLLLLGGCGLSDAQLASVWQSVITTALTTMMSQWATTLFGAASGAT